MNELRKLQTTLLAAGDISGLLSLVLPAVKHGKTLLGAECLALSLVLMVPSIATSPIRFRDLVIALSGIANLWLMFSWAGLLFTNRRVSLGSGIIGYLAFPVAIASSTQVEAVSIGYFLWILSFLLVATGFMIKFRIESRNNSISPLPPNNP